MILSSDWHLDDRPENEYRWSAFEQLYRIADKHGAHSDRIYILGDLLDRKDYYSSELVNRLVNELVGLQEIGSITILMGNHDRNIAGPPYWDLLNHIHPRSRVRYISEPYARGRLLMLPYSPKPAEDWADIDFSLYHTAFMHQTVTGAQVRGQRLEGIDGQALLPRRMKVYSGDIHHPQDIGPVTYVGAPHPINFGDDYQTRMLVLDSAADFVAAEPVRSIRKHNIRLRSLADLDQVKTMHGDQAQIEMVISASRMEQWTADRQAIADWAAGRQVRIASIQAVIETASDEAAAPTDFQQDPESLLRAFAEAEQLDDELTDIGLQILEQAA